MNFITYGDIGIYDADFFDGIDGVTNALDNVKARMSYLPPVIQLLKLYNRPLHGSAMCILQEAFA